MTKTPYQMANCLSYKDATLIDSAIQNAETRIGRGEVEVDRLVNVKLEDWQGNDGAMYRVASVKYRVKNSHKYPGCHWVCESMSLV